MFYFLILHRSHFLFSAKYLFFFSLPIFFSFRTSKTTFWCFAWIISNVWCNRNKKNERKRRSSLCSPCIACRMLVQATDLIVYYFCSCELHFSRGSHQTHTRHTRHDNQHWTCAGVLFIFKFCLLCTYNKNNNNNKIVCYRSSILTVIYSIASLAREKKITWQFLL